MADVGRPSGVGIMDRVLGGGGVELARHGGIHPPPAQGRAEHLHWYPTAGQVMRVVEYTCSCAVESYEYGTVGGAYRIRRTVRRPGRQVRVYDTPVVRRTVAAEWWRKLQAGEAF